MNKTINLGAYGWRQKHWSASFYPEDLPVDGEEDWRLAYYSNEFNAVMVPVNYWRTTLANDCEGWLDSVHPEFQFFVECDSTMFDQLTMESFTVALEVLKPQLSALVFNKGLDASNTKATSTKATSAVEKQLIRLATSLDVDLLGDEIDSDIPSPRFTFFEDELTDLRSARAFVDQYANQLDEADVAEAVIIVDHPQLQADNLSKFKSVLDIMGY